MAAADHCSCCGCNMHGLPTLSRCAWQATIYTLCSLRQHAANRTPTCIAAAIACTTLHQHHISTTTLWLSSLINIPPPASCTRPTLPSLLHHPDITDPLPPHAGAAGLHAALHATDSGWPASSARQPRPVQQHSQQAAQAMCGGVHQAAPTAATAGDAAQCAGRAGSGGGCCCKGTAAAVAVQVRPNIMCVCAGTGC